MNVRRFAILAALLLAGLMASCETTTGTLPSGADFERAAATLDAAANQMRAQATAQAVATAYALDATRRAQDLAARATADALNAAGTAQALTMEATRAAWSLNSTATAVAAEAKATAQAATAQAAAAHAEATRQAEIAHTTATAQAAALAVQQTAQAVEAYNVEATRQAVERQAQRERSTQALKAFGPWALIALGIVLLIIVGYHALPVLLARWRVIRRRADEGEPLVMLERGADGSERIALPLRSFWHLFDTGDVPAAPPPELQDRTAGRQQLSNVMLALTANRRNGKKRRTAHRAALPRPAAAQLPAGAAIQIVEPDQVRPWIEDVETQLIEEVNQ